MKIFLACPVRGVSPFVQAATDAYVARLEAAGHVVHYPPRDTDQTARGLDICAQNRLAVQEADEFHVFYDPRSQGTHFDMGMAFALGKRVVVANKAPLSEGKSYPRMLAEWEQSL